jgi:hypothetical protein
MAFKKGEVLSAASKLKRKTTFLNKRFANAFASLLKMGMTQEEIEKVFGIGKKTGRLRKSDPVFREKYTDAMNTLEAQLSGKLITQAIGYDYTEEKTTYSKEDDTQKDGKTKWKEVKKEVYKKHQPGNSSAFQFLLTNRFKDNWKHSKEVTNKDEGYDSSPSQRNRKHIEAIARDVLAADPNGNKGKRKFQDGIALLPCGSK